MLVGVAAAEGLLPFGGKDSVVILAPKGFPADLLHRMIRIHNDDPLGPRLLSHAAPLRER